MDNEKKKEELKMKLSAVASGLLRGIRKLKALHEEYFYRFNECEGEVQKIFKQIKTEVEEEIDAYGTEHFDWADEVEKIAMEMSQYVDRVEEFDNGKNTVVIENEWNKTADKINKQMIEIEKNYCQKEETDETETNMLENVSQIMEKSNAIEEAAKVHGTDVVEISDEINETNEMCMKCNESEIEAEAPKKNDSETEIHTVKAETVNDVAILNTQQNTGKIDEQSNVIEVNETYAEKLKLKSNEKEEKFVSTGTVRKQALFKTPLTHSKNDDVEEIIRKIATIENRIEKKSPM